jgi:hypothetical protein
MAKVDTLFTVAGITTHTGTAPNGTVSTRTKVRYGTDLIRLVKMLNNPKKIEDKTLGICLAPVRVDFVELPTGMLKADAIKFLATHPDFQSAADQAVLQEALSERQPKAPRTPKTPKAPKVKAAKAKPSIDSIKSRAKKQVTPEQIVAAALSAEVVGK